MNSIKLQIKTGSQKYPIHIGNNVINKLQKLLKENLIDFNQCLIIVDKNVPKKLISKTIKHLHKKKIVLQKQKSKKYK